jgi:diacylglycerol kinase (ATP)
MRVKVIVNPYANRWRAKEKLPAIEAALVSSGLAFDVTLTEGPGEATTEARSAAATGYDAVVAAGGDGTISEVLNGLIESAPEGGPTLPFGIMPVGTANDFADMVEMPRDLTTLTQLIAAGKTRQIDAAQIRVGTDPSVPPHYFNNNSAAAMEPMVTLEHIRMTRLSGELRYVVALIRALWKLKAWQMRIEWDGGSYEGPAYLLSLCNSPRTGGFYMAPGAETDDGLLDMILAPEVSKRTVLAILGRLLRGTHVSHPSVTSARTTSLEVWSEPGTPVHADGEIVSESASYLRYHVLPGKITLLTA